MKTKTKTIRAEQLKAGDTFAFDTGEVFAVRRRIFLKYDPTKYLRDQVRIITYCGWQRTVDADEPVERYQD